MENTTEEKIEETQEISIDILRKLEVLSNQINGIMAARGKTLFHRYPLTFALITLFAAGAVGEGAKGIMELFGWANHPFYLFFGGIIVLVIIGRLYKKLK